MNKVVLIGRLVKDPELRFTAGSGTAVARFTVAVNRRKKKDQEKADTDFINCVAFGKTAETISQYFVKGQQIAVNGNIRTGSYEAQDGTKRYTTDVAVESFEFVGSNGNRSNDGQNNYEREFNDYYDDGNNITPVDSSDMPF